LRKEYEITHVESHYVIESLNLEYTYHLVPPDAQATGAKHPAKWVSKRCSVQTILGRSNK